MDESRFDEATKDLSRSLGRRNLVRVLAGTLPIVGVAFKVATDDVEAKGKSRGKKKAKGKEKAKNKAKSSRGGSTHVCVCHKNRQVVCPDDDGVLNGHIGHGDCICAGQPGGSATCQCDSLSHNADCKGECVKTPKDEACRDNCGREVDDGCGGKYHCDDCSCKNPDHCKAEKPCCDGYTCCDGECVEGNTCPCKTPEVCDHDHPCCGNDYCCDGKCQSETCECKNPQTCDVESRTGGNACCDGFVCCDGECVEGKTCPCKTPEVCDHDHPCCGDDYCCDGKCQSKQCECKNPDYCKAEKPCCEGFTCCDHECVEGDTCPCKTPEVCDHDHPCCGNDYCCDGKCQAEQCECKNPDYCKAEKPCCEGFTCCDGECVEGNTCPCKTPEVCDHDHPCCGDDYCCDGKCQAEQCTCKTPEVCDHDHPCCGNDYCCDGKCQSETCECKNPNYCEVNAKTGDHACCDGFTCCDGQCVQGDHCPVTPCDGCPAHCQCINGCCNCPPPPNICVPEKCEFCGCFDEHRCKTQDECITPPPVCDPSNCACGCNQDNTACIPIEQCPPTVCGRPNHTCNSTADCCEDPNHKLECMGGVCLIINGYHCDTDEQCGSKVCEWRVRRKGKKKVRVGASEICLATRTRRKKKRPHRH